MTTTSAHSPSSDQGPASPPAALGDTEVGAIRRRGFRPGTSPKPPSPRHKANPILSVVGSVLSLVAASSLVRLYSGPQWLFSTGAMVLLTHLWCWIARRIRMHPIVQAVLCFPFTIWLALLLTMRDTLALGLFPGGGTIGEVHRHLLLAAESFQRVNAPTPPEPGFLLVTGVLVGLMAFLMDWVSLRMQSALEAIAPGAVIVVFCAGIGARGPVWPTIAYVGAAATFLGLHRALVGDGRIWFGGHQHRAITATALAAGTMAVAVTTAAAFFPFQPRPSDAYISWGAPGEGLGGTRNVTSPIADLRGRLVDQSEVQVLEVQANRPLYWRLTSLDTFNGQVWSANERYQTVRGPLTGGWPGTQVEQHIRVDNLSSLWLPSAYRATSFVNGPRTVRVSFNPDTGSLTSSRPSADGLEYTVMSTVPNLPPDRLRTVGNPAGTAGLEPEAATRYLSLPNLPSAGRGRSTAGLARQVTAGQETRYDKALALQNYFRTNYTYDLNARLRTHDSSAINQFLFPADPADRRGYCEQFAAAFAVMARSVGLPTRVAIGFTPGEQREDGRYIVRNKNAHSWPEVYFPDVGWLAFEPTPSYANPSASQWTGLSYDSSTGQQATLSTTTTTAPGSTTTGASDTATSAPPTANENPQEDPNTTGSVEAPDWMVWAKALGGKVARVGLTLLLLIGLVPMSAWILFTVRIHKMRHRTARVEDADRTQACAAEVHTAWHHAVDTLGDHGAPYQPHQTIDEYLNQLWSASGMGSVLGVGDSSAAGLALRRLGNEVVEAAYQQDVKVSPEQAWKDANMVRGAVRSSLTGVTWLLTTLRWYDLRREFRYLVAAIPVRHP